MRINTEEIYDMPTGSPEACQYGDYIMMLREDYDQNNIDQCKTILFDQICSTGMRVSLDLSTIRFKTTHMDDYVVSSPFSAHQLIPVSIISWTATAIRDEMKELYDVLENTDFDSVVLKHLEF